MKGNFHVRFLEEGEGAISPSYSAMTRMRTVRKSKELTTNSQRTQNKLR